MVKRSKAKVESVKKNVKEATKSSLPPSYFDWCKAEDVAIQDAIHLFIAMRNKKILTYNFGKDYKKAVDLLEFIEPVILIDTDLGEMRIEIDDMVIEKKNWWSRHFFGEGNNKISVAIHVKMQLHNPDDTYQINSKWCRTDNMDTIMDVFQEWGWHLRDCGENWYKELTYSREDECSVIISNQQ